MKLKYILIAALWFFSFSSWADNMLMVRVNLNFDDTMILMKEKLEEYGYTIAHVQKCDGGMQGMGYKTEQYKLIFFGKFEETRALSKQYPEIIPFLPLKVAVIEEKNNIVVSALNASILSEFFQQPELTTQFARWESDLRAILDEMKQAEMQGRSAS